LPHYLALAVPAALFLGVLLGVRRLHLDSELTVVHVAGIPFTRLLRPVVGLALLLGILVAINAAVVQPHARYAHRATLHDLVTRPVQFDLEAGVFHAFGNGTVLRADRIAKGGSVLQGVFAARRTDAGERVMVVAAEGRIALGQDGRILVMRLFNGDLIRTGGSESAERVGFDNYVWRVPLGSRAPYGERGQDERELTLTELAAGDRDRLPQSVTSDQVAAELSARLIEPASLPLLALLAAPFAVLGGGGRTARATNLVLAVGVLILYQKLLGFAEALAAQGSVAPLLSQWAVLVGFAVLTAALIRVVTNGLSRRRRAFAPAKAGADAETA
jgi:lipopolysaccharide export system permease protein